MSQLRAFSSPELLPYTKPYMEQPVEDVGLQGVTTSIKVLLKLIRDHHEASIRDQDNRKMQRIASMMTILDDVKAQIQKSQSSSGKRELRRCSTELKPNRPVRDKKSNEPLTDDNKLRKELNETMAARKGLEMMCSCLGKEKEIMALELARKVQELEGTEELIHDLKAQNNMLLSKVQACAAEHKEKKCGGAEAQGNATLQERNKTLSEQLLKSLEAYKSLKRKYKDAQEENTTFHNTMKEMGKEVTEGLGRIQGLKEKILTNNVRAANLAEEISALEHIFENFNMKICEHREKKR